MINATISPTAPFGAGRIVRPPARGIPTALPGQTASDSPVILVRGCNPVALTTTTGPATQWSVEPTAGSISAPPALTANSGAATTLSTNAIGLFRVHASGGGQELDWYVRFIDFQIAGPATVETSDTPSVNPHRSGFIALVASTECDFDVVLTGSDDQPACYDKVTVGILQDMLWEPGQTLYGSYCARGSNNVLGQLFEPVPVAPSPDIDSGFDQIFPFYDASVDPTGGPNRHVSFEDSPGIVIPLLYNPADGIERPFHRSWADDPAYLLLREIAGSISFVSALGAITEDAPYSFTVSAKINWDLTFSQPVAEIPPDAYNVPFGDINFSQYMLPSPTPPNGTTAPENPTQVIPNQDACVASLETFDPRATKSTKQYLWVPQTTAIAQGAV